MRMCKTVIYICDTYFNTNNACIQNTDFVLNF